MQKKYSSSVRVFYPKFSREEIVEIIRSKQEELKQALPIKLVVLFGSYAKGKHTVASDIDLLVVYKGETGDAYRIVKNVIDLPKLEPHVYSEKEYAVAKDVIERMMEDGIVIYKDKEI
jgi:hypothetical protein